MQISEPELEWNIIWIIDVSVAASINIMRHTYTIHEWSSHHLAKALQASPVNITLCNTCGVVNHHSAVT